jgi:hypothetical protein
MTDEFVPFPKMPRLSRNCVITEKLDGTNAQVVISEDGLSIRAGSRNRWIDAENDNYGFAKWVERNRDDLLQLGPGRHFGEWWGLGIQRGYGLDAKRFSLFNVGRWNVDNIPDCCEVVPTLYSGEFSTTTVEQILWALERGGSIAAPGFMDPEGVIVFHQSGGFGFKKTIKNDESPKGMAA